MKNYSLRGLLLSLLICQLTNCKNSQEEAQTQAVSIEAATGVFRSVREIFLSAFEKIRLTTIKYKLKEVPVTEANPEIIQEWSLAELNGATAETMNRRADFFGEVGRGYFSYCRTLGVNLSEKVFNGKSYEALIKTAKLGSLKEIFQDLIAPVVRLNEYLVGKDGASVWRAIQPIYDSLFTRIKVVIRTKIDSLRDVIANFHATYLKLPKVAAARTELDQTLIQIQTDTFSKLTHAAKISALLRDSFEANRFIESLGLLFKGDQASFEITLGQLIEPTTKSITTVAETAEEMEFNRQMQILHAGRVFKLLELLYTTSGRSPEQAARLATTIVNVESGEIKMDTPIFNILNMDFSDILTAGGDVWLGNLCDMYISLIGARLLAAAESIAALDGKINTKIAQIESTQKAVATYLYALLDRVKGLGGGFWRAESDAKIGAPPTDTTFRYFDNIGDLPSDPFAKPDLIPSLLNAVDGTSPR